METVNQKKSLDRELLFYVVDAAIKDGRAIAWETYSDFFYLKEGDKTRAVIGWCPLCCLAHYEGYIEEEGASHTAPAAYLESIGYDDRDLYLFVDNYDKAMNGQHADEGLGKEVAEYLKKRKGKTFKTVNGCCLVVESEDEEEETQHKDNPQSD